MKRGFILSTDGMFALAVVALMMAGFIAYYQIGDERSRAAKMLDDKARDAAIVAFYLGEDAAGMGVESNISGADAFGACSNIFVIDTTSSSWRNTSSQTMPTKESFCVGGR